MLISHTRPIPPSVQSGGLQVFSLDGSWLDRLVILTSRAIFVISIDDCLDEDGNHPERVMDVIPLEGIEFIGLSNNHEDAAVPEAFATGKFAAASTPTHRHLRGSNSKGHASNDGSKKGVMSGNGSWESAKLSAWNSVCTHQSSNSTPFSKSIPIFHPCGPVAHHFLSSLWPCS